MQLSDAILILTATSLKYNTTEGSDGFWEEQLWHSVAFKQKKQSSNRKSPQDLQTMLSFILKHN